MKHLCFAPVIWSVLSTIVASDLNAQSFTILHPFTAATDNTLGATTNSDGAGPTGPLVVSSNAIYGVCFGGGAFGSGTLYEMNLDGSAFTVAHSFNTAEGSGPNGILLIGNTVYGTAETGGASGYGAVFKVNTDGTGFTNMYSFSALPNSAPYNNFDGVFPTSPLILDSGVLLGTAAHGGSAGDGTLFAFDTNGGNFQILNNFISGGGASPLILSNGILYGTLGGRGALGGGSVFSLNSDGTGFATLHSFSTTCGFGCPNADGANPSGRLVLSEGTLYGLTGTGGQFGNGTVFKVRTDGTGFAVIHSLGGPGVVGSGSTNTEGALPLAALTLSGNTLYGTASMGGDSGSGTVFMLKTDGTGFTVLHSFSAFNADGLGANTNLDGAWPQAELVLSGNNLLGTTGLGGHFGSGTVFSIALPAAPSRLTIVRQADGEILINAQGSPNFICRLQRAPTLAGPWSTSAPQTADSSGLIQFHDLFPPADHALYRTVQP